MCISCQQAVTESTTRGPLSQLPGSSDSFRDELPSDLSSNGDNLWIGSFNDDKMIGGRRDEIIFAELGDDFINGKSGRDGVYGGEGDDTLCGGKGKDTVFGGSGADKFLVSRGRDLVRDFNVTEGDVISGFTSDAEIEHKFQAQRLVVSEGKYKMVLTNIDRADYREISQAGVLDFPDPILS